MDGIGGHEAERLHAADGLDLAGRPHEGDPLQPLLQHGVELLDLRVGHVAIPEVLHAVRGVEEETGRLLDLLSGRRQKRAAPERPVLLGDDGPVDPPALEQVQQQRGHDAAVRGRAPDGRVGRARNGGLDHAADGRRPAHALAGFLLELVDLGADGMAQPALDALLDFPVARLAVGVQLQSAVVDGAAEGDAPPAAVA